MDVASTSHSDNLVSVHPPRLSKFTPIKFRRATSASLPCTSVTSATDEVATVSAAAGQEAKEFYESVISSRETTRLVTDSKAAAPQQECIKRRNWKQRKEDKERQTIQSAQLNEIQQRKLANELLQGAQNGNLRKVKNALKQGCNINSTDNFSWTALMCASYSGQTSIVKYLLRRGALWLDRYDKKGRTALGLASAAGHVIVCDILKGTLQESVPSEERTSPRPKYRCEICNADFTEASEAQHESSTLHLFNCQYKPQSTHYHIPESNVGFKLLVKDGWDKEKGLGPRGKGLKFPVKTVLKRDRHGLGANADDPQSKPRVTHFQPYDVTAIKKPKQNTLEKKMRASTLSKKSRQRKESKERAWEIGFRQSFNTLEY